MNLQSSLTRTGKRFIGYIFKSRYVREDFPYKLDHPEKKFARVLLILNRSGKIINFSFLDPELCISMKEYASLRRVSFISQMREGEGMAIFWFLRLTGINQADCKACEFHTHS